MFLNNSQHEQDLFQRISMLKKQKSDEIQASRKRMYNLSQAIINPAPSGKEAGMMKYVHTGMMAYDGIMTGLKIYRRIKQIFHKK